MILMWPKIHIRNYRGPYNNTAGHPVFRPLLLLHRELSEVVTFQRDGVDFVPLGSRFTPTLLPVSETREAMNESQISGCASEEQTTGKLPLLWSS